MNTLYLSILAKEQQRDFLREKLNQYTSSLEKFTEDGDNNLIAIIMPLHP
jgi:hypothetical protein